jgi:YYY domain-containing protein
MLDVIRWYVVVQLLGLAALPYVARFFGNLPDRGYAFARPLGLLIVGVVLWFGAIFGLWANTGAMVAVLLVAMAAVGWLGLRRPVDSLRELWREHRSHIYVVEGLFLGAFLFWAFCRAFFPNIEATEKPMDFMLLNGILRSQRFPPVDPWLSGSSISYYYLGYLLIAVLTELSGVVPSVAFNLAIATLFALTITGAFAVAHALVDGLRRTRAVAAGESFESLARWPSWLAGGLGAGFVALLGNWEGFLEILQAHGFGSAGFWRWIAIIGLDHPYLSTTWYPSDAQDNWWWFRASRVITDYPPGGVLPQSYNTINEFPFFSFLLGDMHPHLMALPFAFVCLGYALSFLRSPTESRLDRLSEWTWDVGFIAFLFGSLFLLNAWDILTYLFVLMCAFAVRRYFSRPAFDLEWVRQSAVFGITMLVLSLLLYWPFYVTFRSQANGLLGIVQLHSHLRHFIIFWGPFLFLAGSLLVAELVFGVSPLPRSAIERSGPAWTRSPITWAVVALISAACFVAHIPVLTVAIPMMIGALALVLRYLAGSDVVASLLPDSARREKQHVKAPVRRTDGKPAEVAGGAVPASWAPEHIYVFVMLFTAMLLLFGTELVFIQDSFNDRMNTVFKLYYQAWEMLAVVGAYAVYYLGSGGWAKSRAPTSARRRGDGERGQSSETVMVSVPPLLSKAWLAIAAVLVGAAFVYVPASLLSRSQGFSVTPTLDGLAYYARFQPEDAAAIKWLNDHVTGTPTILEATGGSYSAFDEVAWMTGLPTVLGWNFHEVQWRGASIVGVVNQRKNDIDTIYRTTNQNEALTLLKKYHVTYVYVGPMERQAYSNDAVGLEKFRLFTDVVYKNPGVTIYKVRGDS